MVKSNKINKKVKFSKNRQELRKEKRLKKKENKRQYFSKLKKNDTKPNKKSKEIKNLNDSNKKKIVNDDDEIESDFELSDNEINTKLSTLNKNVSSDLNKNVKNKNNSFQKDDRFLEDQQREKRKQKELEKKMRKQRIFQLTAANEDEDKVIRKLEKKLRINKHANDKSVHKMFTDGLDYALELCLPENITKMYSAAKEAYEVQENGSEDEFQDDLQLALGASSDIKKKEEKKKRKFEDHAKSNDKKTKLSEKILKKIESKYFKDDTDLSDVDSELENNEIDNTDDKNSLEEELENTESDDESEDSIIDEKSSEQNFDNKVRDSIDNFSSPCDGTEEENNEETDLDNDESVKSYNISIESSHDISNENIEDKKNKNECDESNTWEDIYGRKRDVEGNVIEIKKEIYVPPQIRARITDKAKDHPKFEKLERQCKGLLNRLTEANIIKISKEIEILYRNNSRFEINNVFTELLMSIVITNVLSKERTILEYGMLIAILHVNVGNEISAHILQELIVNFDNFMNDIDKLDVENKKLDNIIFMLCHMYTYKIFQHSLIFEIADRLANKLCEKAVECILLIFKSVGFQLRKDDPLALRDLIQSIQKKSNEADLDVQKNTRFDFMFEILTAIKNNNMNKIPNYDPSLAEHLKKILKSVLTNGKYLSTLNITIDDLLNADKKGKWWVVGSAWTGNLKDVGTSSKTNTGSTQQNDEKYSDQLLELARKERMNTNDRRNIFCAIMSSEDYLDAFEKVLRLSIKDVRLIVSIIIHCCLSEKNFNPYYAVLTEKFCGYDRKYLLAVQFSVWDRIKDIDSLNKQQIENLAKLVLYLVRKGSQPISILKIIEFTEINKATLRFVRIIILAILLGDQTEMIQVFKRIAPSSALNQFKNAIVLFIRHFLLKGSEKSHVPQDKMDLLNDRINQVEEIIFNRHFV